MMLVKPISLVLWLITLIITRFFVKPESEWIDLIINMRPGKISQKFVELEILFKPKYYKKIAVK